jgi:hypothetical protein
MARFRKYEISSKGSRMGSFLGVIAPSLGSCDSPWKLPAQKLLAEIL